MIAGMEEFKKLEQERDRLEAQITSLREYLTEDGMPGVSGPLVDEEGFPRADLDIYAIRKARNSLACAQTDHQDVMKRIEKALHEIHAASRVDVPRVAPADAGNGAALPVGEQQGGAQASAASILPPAFAWIDEVAEGSPAQDAGLALGDHICRFGGIDRRETGDLNACFAAIAQLVPASVGKALEVVVLRGQPPRRVELSLTPRQWTGRGLLGCHLAPKTD